MTSDNKFWAEGPGNVQHRMCVNTDAFSRKLFLAPILYHTLLFYTATYAASMQQLSSGCVHKSLSKLEAGEAVNIMGVGVE